MLKGDLELCEHLQNVDYVTHHIDLAPLLFRSPLPGLRAPVLAVDFKFVNTSPPKASSLWVAPGQHPIDSTKTHVVRVNVRTLAGLGLGYFERFRLEMENRQREMPGTRVGSPGATQKMGWTKAHVLFAHTSRVDLFVATGAALLRSLPNSFCIMLAPCEHRPFPALFSSTVQLSGSNDSSE